MNKIYNLSKYFKIQSFIWLFILLLSINIYNKHPSINEINTLSSQRECGVIKTYDKVYATKNTSYLPVESKNYKWWVIVNNSDINSYKTTPVKYCVYKIKLVQNELFFKKIEDDNESFTISMTIVCLLLIISFFVWVCRE